MPRTFVCSALLLALLLSPSCAQPLLLQPGCGARVATTTCINVGSQRSIGVFRREKQLIRYLDRKPRGRRIPLSSVVADDPRAYAIHRRAPSMRLQIAVPPGQSYVVRLGFIDSLYCERGGVSFSITANEGAAVKVSSTSVACRTSFFADVDAVAAADGLLTLSLQFDSSPAHLISLATLCVTRNLAARASCKQRGCTGWRGCMSYAVASASLAIPGPPCDLLDSAAAKLELPVGSTVLRATLQWAASGHVLTRSTWITLNGVNVTSNRLIRIEDFEPYYSATADITQAVREIGGGDYTVTGMRHNRHRSCPQGHVAAFALTVVYAARGVPYSHVNVCDRNKATSLKRTNHRVRCMQPAGPDATARATIIALEGEQWMEKFSLNGQLLGNNVFYGSSGERLDVIDFDVADYLGARTSTLRFQFEKDSDADSVLIATIATQQTLPQPAV